MTNSLRMVVPLLFYASLPQYLQTKTTLLVMHFTQLRPLRPLLASSSVALLILI